MSAQRAIHFRVTGRVQGVGFRAFTQATALQLEMTGWVRNEPDGSVTGEACGDVGNLLEFLQQLTNGPRYANVTNLEHRETPCAEHNGFQIRR
jgi:acylphosphatase